jgi:2-oxoglutarate ferredoxin oxidoreductase subunit alpha
MLQTEDEPSAGFALIGAVIAGTKAFCATCGPGNVLLQDPMSMAEAMRIPVVVVIAQRGGPSTGSVIYGQQEVTLTGWGGNGEGCRIVYSPSNLQELYDYTIKAFNTAWQYKFPTFVLTDGYLTKMLGRVELKKPKKLIPVEAYLNKGNTNVRNCFDLEEEIFEVNVELKEAFDKMAPKVIESESFKTSDAKIIFIAHGNVGAAARQAVSGLRKEGKKVGLFRPITLNPFPAKAMKQAVKNAKKLIVVEAAQNQLIRLVKENLYGLKIPIQHYGRPAIGITPEEINGLVK